MDPYSDHNSIDDAAGRAPARDIRGTMLRERTSGRLSTLEGLRSRFSPGERFALYAFGGLLIATSLILLAGLNRAISEEVPARGGALVEGSTGPARFINPLISLSQADQDLSILVYSGLLRALPDGTFIPDLAERYEISAEGTVYTFTLRDNLTFHDGKLLTSADVLFTVALAQNPDIKSQHRADWEGVVVTAPDEQTIIFTLPHAYAPFLENATLGILPKHLWQGVTPEEFPFNPLNTHPVGSGPFRFANLKADSTGAATRYDLAPFDRFALGRPFLTRISFLFFPNQEALVRAYEAGQVDSIAGILPSELSALKRAENVVHTPLPRIFGVFFNESHNGALTDASARAALSAAIDKTALVDTVLGGYGAILNGPIPPGIIGSHAPAAPVSAEALSLATTTPAASSFAEEARAILTKGKWTLSSTSDSWIKNKTPLSIKLATLDEPELVVTANAVAEAWRAAGIATDVQVYPLSEFNTSVLRPREYDAILFGEVVGRSADLFAFWHSSQRNDPGLNLSLYANSQADALLSKARIATSKGERDTLYAEFEAVVTKDTPAVFLYAPEFIYVVPGSLEGVRLGALTTPAERFLNVHEWYFDTEYVWSFFTDKTNQ